MSVLLRWAKSLARWLAPARHVLLLATYLACFVVSLLLAYELRFDFAVPELLWQDLRWTNLLWIVPLKLSLLLAFGQFGVLLSFFRLPDLYRLACALGLSTIILFVIWYITEGRDCPPRSVILVDGVASFGLLAFFRTGLRVAREWFVDGQPLNRVAEKRVAIVGAGEAGTSLAATLLGRRGLGLRPVVMLDDDQSKWGREVHGLTVVGRSELLGQVKKAYGVELVVLAIPSAPPKRVRELIELARKAELPTQIVPSLTNLNTGRPGELTVRPVEIQDLLMREPVQLDSASITKLIAGRTVLVTGAGGSIGSELCRQIAVCGPQHLLLVEQSEAALFVIEQALIDGGYGGLLVPVVADIADTRRMGEVLRQWAPSVIFHAAAHKHVPLMEAQPGEAIKNNSLGTARLVDLACEHHVERFVFISTDKAINPTSAMGASKRLAEIYLQARQAVPGTTTRLMAVRFGNVLGSSGSVVSIFQKQIAKGGPVRVTHPEVTRYFMTVGEAVGLVLQCAVQGEGGEIFVLDMGLPVKIRDLAEQMIRLSGFEPGKDIEIVYTGLRPGEKLYEELRHHEETHAPTAHPSIFRFQSQGHPLSEVEKWFAEVRPRLETANATELRQAIRQLIPEYTPFVESASSP